MALVRNIGMVTAYAYARSKGYTGTEDEFAELMASYADVIASKQDKLTAGANITIDANNVISATGGGGGGGAVDSVNGQTGTVVLDASDVGALADNTTYVSSFNGSTGAIAYTAPVTSVNGSTGAVTLTIPDQASEITNDSTVTGDYVDDALDTLSTQITSKADANAVVTSFNGSVGAITYSAPVTSVNGSTGAVTIGNATTSSAGLMSATDKANLDAVYADYQSAINALGA